MVPEELKRYVKVTTRMPREEAIIALQKSHAFLAMAYGNMKGIPSSKLYEYMALGKPVLLCPTDHDIMEQMLAEVELGFFASSAEKCLEQIELIRELYASGRALALKESSKSKIQKYSRFNQLQQIKEVIGE